MEMKKSKETKIKREGKESKSSEKETREKERNANKLGSVDGDKSNKQRKTDKQINRK